jgi:membrane associated rhomboid family serine protease
MFPIRDHNPSHRFPLVTVLIIIINILVFVVQLTAPDTDQFVMQYALVPKAVNWLNPLTLIPFITSMFMHGGWLHIISNMWFLWIFGDNIEASLGHMGFLLFYLVSGLAASFLQYVIDPASSIPMLGASGAIAGVLGAYLVLFPNATIETLVTAFGGFLTRVNIPAGFMLIYWFATQLFSGVGSIAVGSHNEGGVAFFAHIGGFAVGYLLARFLIKPRLTFYRLE